MKQFWSRLVVLHTNDGCMSSYFDRHGINPKMQLVVLNSSIAAATNVATHGSESQYSVHVNTVNFIYLHGWSANFFCKLHRPRNHESFPRKLSNRKKFSITSIISISFTNFYSVYVLLKYVLILDFLWKCVDCVNFHPLCNTLSTPCVIPFLPFGIPVCSL